MEYFSIMSTDIAMYIIPDDRFKVLGILKNSDSDKYSKSQIRVALSLACIIRSIIFSEYYKHNSSPNTLFILDRLIDELSILKDIGSYYHNWLNRSLFHVDLLLLKLHVP